MSVFNIFWRSGIVLFVIALIIIPVRYGNSVLDYVPGMSGNSVETVYEVITPSDAEFKDGGEIFKRSSYSYLAEETLDLRPISGNRPVDDTVNRLVVAKNLAGEELYGRALVILANVTPEDEPSYDVRMLRAEILTRSGEFARANQIYENLRREYPYNPDVMVSHGNMFIAEGRLQTAESLFSRVLVEYPGFESARAGLSKVRQSRSR